MPISTILLYACTYCYFSKIELLLLLCDYRLAMNAFLLNGIYTIGIIRWFDLMNTNGRSRLMCNQSIRVF